MELLFQAECTTRSGKPITHSAYSFELTRENATKFYEKAKSRSHIFGQENTQSIEQFLDTFFYLDPTEGLLKTKNLFVIIDDFVGVVSLTNIAHPHDALMHFTFFDGVLFGRHNIIKEAIRYAITKYGFNRLSAEIPCYIRKEVMRFVSKDVGLIMEGRKRKAATYKGELFDVMLYGITSEDITKWDSQEQKQSVVEAQHQLQTTGITG